MKTQLSLALLPVAAVVTILTASCGGGANPDARSTVPSSTLFTLDHNRMIVEVELDRPDGSRRTARAWVDTGNQFLIVAEELALDIGLDRSALDQTDVSRPLETSSPAPPVFLGGSPLNVDGVAVQVTRGSRVWAGVPADMNLPASVFRDLHVVFDYPQRRLTVAETGQVQSVGLEVPCRIHPETGLFQVAATIDGNAVELGVDTGSVGTWLSADLTRAAGEQHPDWPQAIGAVGSVNFFGFPFESGGTLMRLPEIRIGAVHADEIAVLGLDRRLFDWYSMKSAAPVVGILGANVLRGFRLEVDYPSQMSYWQPGPPLEPTDLDIVGLTLRPEADGSYTVAGVVQRDGVLTVKGVEPGDTLRRIGSLETHGASMGTVIEALRGMPGESRRLVVERGGERIEVEAVVTRFP